MRLAFRDIEIDPDRFELVRAGEPVRLEPQAFEVLAHLIQHRDRVVTRDELMEAIWGTVYVSDAALATRIKEARRALGDDGATQWAIRTIHRRGYRFVVEIDEQDRGRPERSSAIAASATAVLTPPAVATRTAEVRSTAPSTAPHTPAPVAPVGRTREFQRLLDTFESTQNAGAQVVFITGEAGIGKSTLVGEFMRHVSRLDDVLIGRGQCIEGHGAGEAYLPFLDAIGQLASGPRGGVAVRALQLEAPTWLFHMPGLAEGAPRFDETVLTRERMLRELTNALDHMGHEQRVVLSLEDLHWSDQSTIGALEMLSRRDSSARVLILGTVRSGDTVSGTHPVHSLAGELATRGYATTIELGPLDETAIRALIKGRVTEEIHPDVALAVTERSGGNPLFATSLLEHWRGNSTDGDSSVGGVEGVPVEVPESLRQLVSRQLEHVSGEQRQVMEAAAIAGDTLTPAIVAAISGLDLELVEDILDGCARKGQFLRRRGAFEWPNGDLEDEYQFIHSLFRETALGTIPLGRRARMHRGAGIALVERLGTEARGHIDEIANHFVQAGDADRAVPALIQAARRARSRSAQHEARAALDRAMALLPRVTDEAQRIRLEIAAQTLIGATSVALDGWAAPSIQAAYERALDLVRQTDDQELIREILAGLATTHEFRGEYELSQQIISEQIALVPEGMPPPPESHELLACSLFHQGQLRRSFEEATTGLRIATSEDAPAFHTAYGEHPATACHGWRVQSRWFLGEVRQALEELQTAIEAAPDELSQLHAHTHAAMVAQYSGDTRATRHHARRMFALARRLGFESHEVESGLLRAWAESRAGYPAAVPLVGRAVDAYRSSGLRMDLPWVLATYADALLAHDHVDDAERALDEAFQVRDPGRGYVYEPEMWRLRGNIAELRDAPTAAAEHYRRAAETARSHEACTPELRALTALLKVDPDAATAERTRALLDAIGDDGLERDVAGAREALEAYGSGALGAVGGSHS